MYKVTWQHTLGYEEHYASNGFTGLDMAWLFYLCLVRDPQVHNVNVLRVSP